MTENSHPSRADRAHCYRAQRCATFADTEWCWSECRPPPPDRGQPRSNPWAKEVEEVTQAVVTVGGLAVLWQPSAHFDMAQKTCNCRHYLRAAQL